MPPTRIKRPFQHYDMVEVTWDDAAGLRHGWLNKAEKMVPQLVISVGFLVLETADHILIAQDTDEEGSHNGRTQIPRGMVKSMKVLRQATKPKAEKVRENDDVQALPV